jgi:phosphatidate cytidylyltransferase
VIPRRGPAAAKASLVRRILSAVVFIPAFLLLLYGAGVGLFSMFVLLLSARAQWEFTRMFQRDGETVYPLLGLLAGVAVTASFHWEGSTPHVLTAALVVLLSAPLVGSRAPDFRPTALTLLGVGYVNWLLGYAIWLRQLPHGAPWIVFLLAVTWMGETAAYIVGSRLTGLAGGLLLGVIGQCGDLAESVLKRSAHTKDTGELIPGHGGLLDRLDSLLFNTPALFYYARYVG